MQDQALNRYWKTVVDTIQDGVMVVDVSGTIVSANLALAQITGYDQTELIGQPCSVLNCSSCETVFERTGCHWCLLFSIRLPENAQMHPALARTEAWCIS